MQLVSNQFVDSNVNPDIISTANKKSRRNMNEDVIVLVIIARLAKPLTASKIKGVNIAHETVETTETIISISI
jgi:hypothetical protein